MASSKNLDKRAERLFESATDEDLDHPKVFLDTGNMACSKNLDKRAKRLFESATDEDLDHPKVFLDTCNMASKNLDKRAERLFESATDEDLDHPKVFLDTCNMASCENLEKRAEELFESLLDEDVDDPKAFLDKRRREIVNEAKELVKDIDDIIKCLENYHKACGAVRTVGRMADTSGTVRLLAAGAIVLLGGPASLVLTAARAAVMTAVAGSATSVAASAVEAVVRGKQVKSVQEKMETLKEHIRDYVLYSDMFGQFPEGEMKGKLCAAGRRVLAAGNQLRTLLSTAAANASAKLLGSATVCSSIFSLGSTIYGLVNEIKELDGGGEAEVIQHLHRLKRDVEDIAQGKF